MVTNLLEIIAVWNEQKGGLGAAMRLPREPRAQLRRLWRNSAGARRTPTRGDRSGAPRSCPGARSGGARRGGRAGGSGCSRGPGRSGGAGVRSRAGIGAGDVGLDDREHLCLAAGGVDGLAVLRQREVGVATLGAADQLSIGAEAARVARYDIH